MSPKTLQDATPLAIRRTVIKAAEQHSADTGEDMLVGDLEEALDLLLEMLTAAQRREFLERHWDTLTMGLSDAQLSRELQRRF